MLTRSLPNPLALAASLALPLACTLVGSSLLLSSGCTVESSSDAPAATATTEDGEAAATAGGELVKVDIQGSSTVYPVSAAVAAAVAADNPNHVVAVSRSGSGPGIKAVIAGEADIANASRQIKDSELETAQTDGIGITELTVALDGIAVAVHPDNDWVESMTVAQLKKIWEPDSPVTKWSDVDSSWPDEEIELYGPDTESGTFEYFTDVINGKKKAQRTNYQASSNDNQLVNGIADNKYALGYFGFSYLENNRDKMKGLKIVPPDGGEAVAPSSETIKSGEYAPLTRPLFIYINNGRYADNVAAQAFVEKMVSEAGQELITKAGMVPLGSEDLEASRQTVEGLPKN